MTRHTSPKLTTYTALCSLALVAAVALGQPGLVALAAPFAVALVAGLLSARIERPAVGVRLTVDREGLFEGEAFEMRIALEAEGCGGRCDVGLALPAGLEVLEGHLPRAVVLRSGEPVELAVLLEAHRWGTFTLGPVAVRMLEPGGLFTWEGAVGEALPVTVRAARERLRTLVRPRTVGSAAGEQTARSRADGIEFADVRAFVQGDRASRINWRVTARRGSLHVNEHHPERNTDVVLFLDTFAESGLDETVRIASALADAYLERHDRVGLVGFGGVLSWLEPAGGPRQRERLTEALLGTGSFMSFAWKSVDTIPARTLPARCLVLAISPLVDERMRAAIATLRARRLDVAVVEIPLHLGHDFASTWSGRVALELYGMQRQVMRDRFLAWGVAIVPFDVEWGVEATIQQVDAYRRQARVRMHR